jgi:mono/diheme cytochrome c family protein
MIRILVAVAAAAFLTRGAAAQEMTYGQAEYLNSCAVCHGKAGKGDGPMADELQKRPADLTRLSDKNGGVFPALRVYSTIDGRFVVPAHGDRDMPIWGRQFLEEDRETYGQEEGEVVSSQRIEQLTRYIETLQH